MRKLSTMIFLIIAASGYLIYNTDFAQRYINKNFYPDRYWKNVIKDLEAEIKADKYMIRTQKLEAGRLIASAPFEIREKMETAKLAGADDDAVYKIKEDEVKKVRSSVELLRKGVQKMEDDLQNDQNRLKRARKELDLIKGYSNDSG